jgi:hypothetical protein
LKSSRNISALALLFEEIAGSFLGRPANRRESTHYRLGENAAHVREELIGRIRCAFATSLFHVVGRLANPNWYCARAIRFEMVRPK